MRYKSFRTQLCVLDAQMKERGIDFDDLQICIQMDNNPYIIDEVKMGVSNIREHEDLNSRVVQTVVYINFISDNECIPVVARERHDECKTLTIESEGIKH
jgi:hypothetical protein